ncbi:MAG: type II secretion system F family protein [Pirellulaceae bacterium]|nr:type II secretion system F family protein [Pirellulaceae bacterium]
MPVYSYIARQRCGRLMRRELEARNPVELRSRLCAMDVQLISFQQRGGLSIHKLLSAVKPNAWLPIRSADIELALHQLAMMLRSGLKLRDALKSLQMQTEHKSMSKVLGALHVAVGRGEALSNALTAHRAFPPIVVQMVKVGEQTGSLDVALQQCQQHLADRRAMLTEVRVALSYPVVVTVAALSIAGYLVLVVIPQLQLFLNSLGRKLPAMTQSLVDLSQWLKINGASLIAILSLVLAAFAVTVYSRRGRFALDRCALRLPIFGSVLRLSSTAALSGSLAVMVRSGIRLVDALAIATQMQANTFLSNLLQTAAAGVRRGQPLAPYLSTSHAFSPILGSMVEVAERAGNMDRTLKEVSTLCDTELKSRVKRLSRLVEPAVILIAGGIVGYVYIAFFIALMSAGGSGR